MGQILTPAAHLFYYLAEKSLFYIVCCKERHFFKCCVDLLVDQYKNRLHLAANNHQRDYAHDCQ